MRLSMRKLALWYTKTFKPLMTHDELDHIMATMGFVALPPVHPTCSTLAWKEYVYMASPGRSKSSSSCLSASGEPSTVEPPRPKLPYPRIDGLHIYTYRAFLDAVNFYLEMCDISELFHIRYSLFFPSFFLFSQTSSSFTVKRCYLSTFIDVKLTSICKIRILL